MSKFQLILTGVFGGLILIGVLVFSLGWGSSSKSVVRVTVWGTMSSNLFDNFVREAGLDSNDTIQVTYEEKNRNTFDSEFIEALASGQGPDLFFLPQDSILKQKDKIITIPFDTLSERDFRNTFVEEAELFVKNDGILGMPFIVDPMVTYWNRDMFSNAGVSAPPKFWSELYDLAPRLTKKDANFNITKSLVALGEYNNVTNVDELLALLIMQAGNPITSRRADGSVNNLFIQKLNLPTAPAELALNFYTEFSNPLKPFYSWNRSLPESKSFFLSGDLALYFGFASELSDIRLKNPNLNFDIAPIPQSQGSNRTTTFGRMVSLAIARSAADPSAAFQAATVLTNASSIAALSKITNLPPVRRDLLSTRPTDAYLSIFYDGAVQSRGWLSPESTKLKPIFREMVESITAGRSVVFQAVSRASQQLDAAFR